MAAWTISNIESIKETDAKEMALEVMDIKGHTVYFVEFNSNFGYSALVFKNGNHIHYADQYQLHFPTSLYPTIETLRERYIEILNKKLFLEDEMCFVVDYEDYSAKQYYLTNYWIQQFPYISAWRISGNEKEDKEFKAKTKNMIYNPLSFCYMDRKYEKDIKRQYKLREKLMTAKKFSEASYDYMKAAFLYEMWNHEYGYNWQADYDVVNCFAKVEYLGESDGIDAYLTKAGFSDEIKRAYYDARREYYAKFDAA